MSVQVCVWIGSRNINYFSQDIDAVKQTAKVIMTWYTHLCILSLLTTEIGWNDNDPHMEVVTSVLFHISIGSSFSPADTVVIRLLRK